MGLFDPQWTKDEVLRSFLPYITGDQKKELEKIRQEWNIDQPTFAFLVAGSPGTTKIVNEIRLKDWRKKYPKTTPKQMFALLFWEVKDFPKLAEKYKGLESFPGSREQLEIEKEKAIARVLQNPDQYEILNDVHDLDDLTWCIRDVRGGNETDPYGVGGKIHSILGLRARRNRIPGQM